MIIQNLFELLKTKIGNDTFLPPKIMENSKLIDMMKMNNFVHWPNFQFKIDFVIEILQVFEI
jgi:hypothetical protein